MSSAVYSIGCYVTSCPTSCGPRLTQLSTLCGMVAEGEVTLTVRMAVRTVGVFDDSSNGRPNCRQKQPSGPLV